ncbi:exosortase T [Fulvimarina sp. MAC8]|uniref:exosortase T n=1 Tax=Fulvimarina sp. MAC8 TaxID=3162874 RepID=UPI0032EEC3D9
MSKLSLPIASHVSARLFVAAGFALASAILAAEPVLWLVETWLDPSYASNGLAYAVSALGIAIWSLTSPLKEDDRASRTPALLILIVSALLRLASQILAISIIGGLALALDVYAILLLLRLSERERAVSPFWLTGLFALSMPFERILQRIAGYPLQEASASLACDILGLAYDDLLCETVRIRLEGNDVLVDLPCSGTESLMLALALAVAVIAIRRPAAFHTFTAIVATLAMAILANGMRIALIAAGINHRELIGVDVMAAPWHDAVGYLTLAVSVLPVLFVPAGPTQRKGRRPAVLPRFRASAPAIPYRTGAILAAAFCIFALVIVTLPKTPIDVSASVAQLQMPAIIDGEVARTLPLEPIEEAYFQRFGGQALKAAYGETTLTLVRTASPLRHLHAPDDCLRGLGLTVTFLGSRFEPVPTALYRAEDAEGRSWQVAVSYASSEGEITSSVAAAIWSWLRHPQTRWTSIQRITPWQLPPALRERREAALVAALDLSPSGDATAANSITETE